MHCGSCGLSTSESFQFCGGCGHPFHRRCIVCNFENPGHFSYCGGCGAELPAVKPRAEKPLSRSKSERNFSERRRISVLFCDLIGSTALSELLDPEDLRTIILSYQEMCASVIKQYGGYLAKYLGDGILAYFGYPMAFEDSAYRAVRVGFELTRSIEALSQRVKQSHSVDVAIRISVHTGLVIAGRMGAGENIEDSAVVGKAPNIAARLQEIADRNTVVISEDTYRLVKKFFVTDCIGPQKLKGIKGSITVHKISGLRNLNSQLSGTHDHTSTGPFVGRKSELAKLVRRFNTIRFSEGRTMMLLGDPGIGKTALIKAFKQTIKHVPNLWFECRCSEYHQGSAFYPIIELLQNRFGIDSKDSLDEKRSKLEVGLRALGAPLKETLPWISRLLGFVSEESAAVGIRNPKNTRAKTLHALLWLVKYLAKESPVVLLIEDLHWIDPSTMELLGMILENTKRSSMLMLLTARAGFTPPWDPGPKFDVVNLQPLPRSDTLELIKSIAEECGLSDELIDKIADQTDGVPLFIEELTKETLETRGDCKEAARGEEIPQVPMTLHDSLMARLDRLGSARRLAQTAAVLGRGFSADLLRAVVGGDEEKLNHELAQLLNSDLLKRRSAVSGSEYIFKHALIQEAAYNSLLKSERQVLHGHVADVMLGGFQDIVTRHPEIVARHLTEAGRYALAASFWHNAGRKAYRESAAKEAIQHLQYGLKIASLIKDQTERSSAEVHLLNALGPVYMGMKGYASDEVRDIYSRAEELLPAVKDYSERISTLRGLSLYFANSGDLNSALRIANEMSDCAAASGEAHHYIRAYLAQAQMLFHTGRFRGALEKLDRGREYLEDLQDNERAALIPRIGYLSYGAWSRAICGDRAGAEIEMQSALRLAKSINHPFTQALVECYAGVFYCLTRERSKAYEHAQFAKQFTATYSLPAVEAISGVVAAASAPAGDLETRVAIRVACANAVRLGCMVGAGFYASLLGEAELRAGKIYDARKTICSALIQISQSGEYCWDAELRRLLAISYLEDPNGPDLNEARKALAHCLTLARQQQALEVVTTAEQLLRKYPELGDEISVEVNPG